MALAVLFSLLALSLFGCAKTKDSSATETQQPASNATQSSTEKPKPADTSSNKTTVTLKDVATQEKAFLSELEPLYTKTAAAYNDFITGKLNREQLNSALKAIKPAADELNQKGKDYYKKNQLSSEDKKNELYANGLKYGSKMRSYVADLINTSITGRKVVDLQSKDSNGNYTIENKKYADDELKKYFSDKTKNYDGYMEKLKSVLTK